VQGAALRVAAAPRRGLATRHDALLVRHRGVWVGLDTRRGSGLFAEAVAAGRVPGVEGPLRPEVALDGSRLDFAFPGGFAEVKSASLVVEGEARFPDAPSERAARHAQVLARQARRGRRAVLAFVILRPDARSLAPHAEADPRFARALRSAARAGVEVRAFRCASSVRGLEVVEEVPVRLDP
jgi:sugar fermentation stimulation protein A